MEINDGKGLFDKYGLIDSIIVALDRVGVTGVQNMAVILDSVNKLAALKDGLKKEEADDDHHQQGEDI